MNGMQIFFKSNYIFRVEVIDRVIKCSELLALCIKVPVGHTYGFESELHLVISFFKFLIQLMKLGDVLPETGIAYIVAILVFFERDTYNITVLPRVVIFCLHTASEVNGEFLA